MYTGRPTENVRDDNGRWGSTFVFGVTLLCRAAQCVLQRSIPVLFSTGVQSARIARETVTVCFANPTGIRDAISMAAVVAPADIP